MRFDRLKRREFITLVGGTVATWPSSVCAQRASKVARIGFMVTGSLGSPEQLIMTASFLQGLREQGYVEGQNIVIEYRAADGNIERFTELATELAGLDLRPVLPERGALHLREVADDEPVELRHRQPVEARVRIPDRRVLAEHEVSLDLAVEHAEHALVRRMVACDPRQVVEAEVVLLRRVLAHHAFSRLIRYERMFPQ